MSNTVDMRDRFPHTPDMHDNRCVDCGQRRSVRDTWDMYDPCWVKMADELQKTQDWIAHGLYESSVVVPARWWCLRSDLKERFRERARRSVQDWVEDEEEAMMHVEGK
jgi:hypothetical protein